VLERAISSTLIAIARVDYYDVLASLIQIYDYGCSEAGKP